MAVSVSTLLFFLILITTVSAIPTTRTNLIHHELDTTLRTLSNHGYTLFSNAITTSDIKFHLLSTTDSNFTLFAPKDGRIFDLDMTSYAIGYVSTLKYHVIPNHRLTFSDLSNLASPFLDTLLLHYSVLIGKTRDDDVSTINGSTSVGVIVDGVRVSDPDLFVGTSFVVHGIDGILSIGLNIRHQGFDDLLGSGDWFSQPAVSPVPVSVDSGIAPSPWVNQNVPSDVGVAPASQAGWNVPVGAPVVASAPKAAASVGNHVNETRQKTPIGVNVGNPVKETRQKMPSGANVGRPVKETRQKTPTDANAGNRVKETGQKTAIGSNIGDVAGGKEMRKASPVGAKTKAHRKNKGRVHGHKRHRQQQPRNHDL